MVRDNRETILHYALPTNNESSGIWVAYVNDLIPVGCVLLRPLPEVSSTAVEVKRMYVRNEYRSLGVAQGLMSSLEEYARNQQNDWIYLDTKDDLIAAIKFYQKCGYVSCDRYNDNPQATIFLRKKLE